MMTAAAQTLVAVLYLLVAFRMLHVVAMRVRHDSRRSALLIVVLGVVAGFFGLLFLYGGLFGDSVPHPVIVGHAAMACVLLGLTFEFPFRTSRGTPSPGD
jgi:uncharacterized membrane protein YfcA